MNFVTINNIIIGIPHGPKYRSMFTDVVEIPATLNKEATAPADIEMKGYVFDGLYDTLREDVDISIAVYVKAGFNVKQVALVRNIDSVLYPNHIPCEASWTPNVSVPKHNDNPERNIATFINVINGITLAAIGKSINVTPERVRQIFLRCGRILQYFLHSELDEKVGKRHTNQEVLTEWFNEERNIEEMRIYKKEWTAGAERYLAMLKNKGVL